MQNFHLYILKCNDSSYYIGHTDNLEQRIAQHQDGTFPGYTSARRPVTLVFMQEFTSRDEAFTVEHHIKKWSRAKKEALIAGEFDLLRQRAKKVF